MDLLSNYYIHIIYAVMYTSCIGINLLRQSATGKCGCRLGGALIYYLVVICQHDGIGEWPVDRHKLARRFLVLPSSVAIPLNNLTNMYQSVAGVSKNYTDAAATPT